MAISFSGILAIVGGKLSSGFLKKLLTGAGLGLVTSAVSLTALNSLMSHLQSSYTALGIAANLLSLAGFDVGLSIILGAMVVKMTVGSGKISLGKST